MGSTEQTGPGKVTLSSTAMWSLSWLLSLLLLQTSQGSLMSRIGLRLGAAHLKKSALDHKPRTPWAVRNMKEEMLANERKPWQPPKQRQFSESYEEESRPKACVGICYYNKLMALEAKEDLATTSCIKTRSKSPVITRTAPVTRWRRTSSSTLISSSRGTARRNPVITMSSSLTRMIKLPEGGRVVVLETWDLFILMIATRRTLW